MTLSQIGWCQYYKSAASIHAGNYAALSYKSFVTESMAYEVIASGRNDGVQLTGLYESYIPTKLSQNLFLYYGGGFSMGFERYTTRGIFEVNSNSPNNFQTNLRSPKLFMMGLESIFGMEYRFTAPITVGMNIKPRFSFIGMRYARLQFWDVSLNLSFLI